MRYGIRMIVACALLAAIVADAPAQSGAAMDALVAAAKKEGEVVVYTGESEKQASDTSKAFEAKFGIKVQATRFPGGQLMARYGGERQSNVVVADVVIVPYEPFIPTNPTWWVPLNEATVPGYDSFPAVAKGPLMAVMNYNVIAIAWNTNLVKPADEPKGYLDLVDNPAFAAKGSVLIADPRASPSYMNAFKVLVEKYGEGYFKKLMDRGVAIAASGAPGVQQVAAGANKVMLIIFPNNVQTVIDAGGPVKYRQVADPATGIDNILALSSNAKHPNAARLYASWRMSEEGQKAMCKAGGSTSPLGSLPGCEPPVPPNYIKTDFKVYQDKQWQAKYLPWLGLKPL